MSLHKFVHQALEHAPDPITGTVGGVIGGSLVGTVATGVALHGAGFTVASVVATASTVGVGAAVSTIGVVASPIFGAAVGCCALYGAVKGTMNWVKGGCKIAPPW